MKLKHPSPKDIEEMRARGYEAATIEKATEQSKRWHLAQEIAAHIREAFSGVTLGRGVGLHQAQGMDGYEDETTIAAYRDLDEKLDWSRIPPDALNECSSSLSFFDAEGMRFHLPAYLLADLDGTYKHGMAYHLTDVGGFEQFALLSPMQHAAVCEFLQYIVDEESYIFQRSDISRALNEYWLK
ncbi:MAG TPA: DUF6714 family protein [Gammaproteobacteria bacterium]